MIYLKGIHLMDDNDDINALHKQANKFGLSKSWFNLKPKPHYNIISGYILDVVSNFLYKQEQILKKNKR